MHPNAQRVQEALAGAGVDVEVVEFVESTRTAAEAAGAIGTTVAQIVKSLVFLAGEAPLLVIASGANRVSLTKAAAIAGADVHRADAGTVRRVTGFPIGGVPPVGLQSPLQILIDRDLLRFDHVWAAAGTPNAVFRITPSDLVRVTGGEVADVREDGAGA